MRSPPKLPKPGGAKGSGVLTKLRKLPAVVEHKSAELRPSEFPQFVSAEVRSHGARIEGEAATVLARDAIRGFLRHRGEIGATHDLRPSRARELERAHFPAVLVE